MDFITQTKNYYYEKRKRFSFWEKRKNVLTRPNWLKENTSDPLNGQIDDAKLLFEEGKLVLGCLIQANELLYQDDNRRDCPACFLYSEKDYFHDHWEELLELAEILAMYKYKEYESCPPYLHEIVHVIKDERIRNCNYILPKEFTSGRKIYYTTVLVYPRHLPERKIEGSFLPLLVYPEQTVNSIVLPKYFWQGAPPII